LILLRRRNVKINWKQISISIVSGAVLLVGAAVVSSQQPPEGPRPGPPPMGPGGPGFRGGPGGPGGPREGFGPFGPFGRELNLTEDQKAQLKKIGDSFREGDKALLDQMRTLHESEPDLVNGAFNGAAVRSAAEARAKIQVELEVSHARMMSQMFGVLTAEQKAQLAAHHDQMKRMGPPPPPSPAAEPFL
jgi:Spy/CpxP family protein refolding chaperone